MKKGEHESENNTTIKSNNMISLGPQNTTGTDHQNLYKAKSRIDKNLESRGNCVVMPIGDGRLNGGLIPMYPLNFVPNFMACKMGTPFPFPPTGTPMASFGLMREIELQSPKMKDGERASSPNNTVRNSSGVAPTVISHQIEISSLNFVKANSNSTSPTKIRSSDLNADDDTESSSTFSDQSSDSDFEDEDRVLVRNWEKDRCEVAWKWSWLQLQVNELKKQLKECEKQSEERRSKKPKLILNFKEDESEHSARTSGLFPPKEFTKFVFKESQGATVLDRTTHSVLKVKALKRKHAIEDEDEYKPSFNTTPEVTPKKRRILHL